MAGYIGNIPTPQATQSRQSFTATASQTTFATIGYTPNFVDVYLNGVHLLNGTDYTATNSSDVVLTVGAAVSDVIEVISYETFAVLDQTFVGATEVTSAGTTTLTVSSTGTGDADALLVLDSADGGESEVRFFHDGVHGASIQWYTDGSPDLNITTVAGTDGVIDFQPNNSLAMRIDSSGNVIMGKTVADNTTEGFTFYGAADGVSIVKASGEPLILNRLTNDGNILTLRKDSTTVGSIGTFGGVSYYGGPSGGLMFNGVNINPTNGTSTRTDGTNDIGATIYRFKDLHLSGGVYLGGTGSANKLDDYEEGTWTPTISGLTLSISHGRYTKVGRVVTAQFNINSSAITSSTLVGITGFPFAPDVTNGAGRSGGFLAYSSNPTDYKLLFRSSGTTLEFRAVGSGSIASITNISGQQYFGTAIYTTAS